MGVAGEGPALIGAAIILVLLVHGWWMTHMTPRPDRLSNYAWFRAWLRLAKLRRYRWL
jgi:hypothetical protein